MHDEPVTTFPLFRLYLCLSLHANHPIAALDRSFERLPASYFRQVGQSLSLPMHPSPGARLPDLILTYFVYSTLFYNLICLLPADTDRSVRNSAPSIPSEPSCRNSVSCPSKSSASIVLDFVCATPFDIAICLLPADTNCSFRNFVPSFPSEPNRRISVLPFDHLGSDSREFCMCDPI